MKESRCISHHQKGVPRPRQKHVEPLRGGHEPNVPGFIAAGQCRDDDIALLTLIIICDVFKFGG